MDLFYSPKLILTNLFLSPSPSYNFRTKWLWKTTRFSSFWSLLGWRHSIEYLYYSSKIELISIRKWNSDICIRGSSFLGWWTSSGWLPWWVRSSDQAIPSYTKLYQAIPSYTNLYQAIQRKIDIKNTLGYTNLTNYLI